MTYSRPTSYHWSEPPGGPNGQSRKWPKLLGFVLVVAVALGAGIALGSGESPGTLVDRFREDPAQAVAEVAPATNQTVPEPSGSDDVNANSTGGEQAATSDEGDTGQNGGSFEIQAAQDEESSSGESSKEDAGTEHESASDVVAQFAELWMVADYQGMYDLLTPESQNEISGEDFVARYDGIGTEIGLNGIGVTLSGEADLGGKVPVQVEYGTSLVGSFQQKNVIQAVDTGNGWKISWTPSAVLANLGDRCVEYTGESTKRGSIVDRDGELLAYDGIVNQIGIIPGMLENETQTIAALSKLIDMKTTDIKERYADAEPEWFMPVTVVPDPIDTEILNGISNMPGVAIRETTTRIYPHGPVTAHITGYVTPVDGEDLEADSTGLLEAGLMIGRAGLEASANDLLMGDPGGRISLVNCATRIEEETVVDKPGVAPEDLILTIDLDFQQQVDKALGDVKGAAVVIDPQSGAIMAMVSHPTFDPNLFVKGLSTSEARQIFDEDERPLLNRATQRGYPTGSIFKIITTAAAMAHLGYEGGSELYCPRDWSIPGTSQVWHDWTFEYGLGDQGWMNLHNALVNSCNTIFYELGYQLDDKDPNLLPNMAKAFGLGAPEGIPYVQEIAGTVPSPDWKLEVIDDYWATGDAINLSIGQGFLEATPLQMANAYAAIANGGTLWQPYLVDAIRNTFDGSTKTVSERVEIRQLPLDESDVGAIQSALRDQTSNANAAGSASVFGDFQWPIAGKTGTAQNNDDLAEKPHSWFAAFGPYGDVSDIASVVLVESSGEGVSYAAPTTRTIYENWLATASS